MIRLDDIGNAQRLHQAHRDTIRYVPAWKTWCTFTGDRWEEDLSDVRVTELAKGVVDELWAEVPGTPDDERKALVAHARQSGLAPRLAAAVKLTRGLPGIAARPDELDADPMLLNCTNGTLDLRTRQLRAHNPADLLTRRTDAAYWPNATAPTWQAFLERVIPDDEVRAFLQRVVGYTLTGEVHEHILLVLIGPGANGKSTFMTGLRAVFGDYSAIARHDLLIESKHGPHDAGRVALQGRRLVAVSEIDRGESVSEAGVKELTGGERITARRLYGQAFEIEPTWTIWLSANHAPRVRGTDEAIWRRLRIVDFPVTIPGPERDHELGAKLRAEADGILTWAVEGLAEYQRVGLADPAAVIVSTAAYRSHEDIVGRFLADHELHVDADNPELVIESTSLTDRLDQWTAETGVRLGRQRLTEELQRLGAVRAKSDGRRIWRNLGHRDTQGHLFQRSTHARAQGEVAEPASLVSLTEHDLAIPPETRP